MTWPANLRIAGHFPELPPTPKPLGTPIEYRKPEGLPKAAPRFNPPVDREVERAKADADPYWMLP
jgi:hypothetical protein